MDKNIFQDFLQQAAANEARADERDLSVYETQANAALMQCAQPIKDFVLALARLKATEDGYKWGGSLDENSPEVTVHVVSPQDKQLGEGVVFNPFVSPEQGRIWGDHDPKAFLQSFNAYMKNLLDRGTHSKGVLALSQQGLQSPEVEGAINNIHNFQMPPFPEPPEIPLGMPILR